MFSPFESGQATDEEITAENERRPQEERRRRIEDQAKKVCPRRPFVHLFPFPFGFHEFKY